MPVPRSEIVDFRQPGLYHCISRCVRRAFLCGGKDARFDRRRQWLENRLRELAEIFAIDVVSYSMMCNHLHVLAWTDPSRVEGWSASEVARRWLTLFPRSIMPDESLDDAVRRVARDRGRIEQLRPRLACLRWFNRCLKEPLARMANKEDGCKGHFWEGRFRSYRVVGDAGALTCSVYIDLNAIRAGIAPTPESSHHTSVRERIRARQEALRPRRGRGGNRAAATRPQASPRRRRPPGSPRGRTLARAAQPRSGTAERPAERAGHRHRRVPAPGRRGGPAPAQRQAARSPRPCARSSSGWSAKRRAGSAR
jgi:hypothetical protein